MSKIKNNCINCGKEICKSSTRCMSCAKIGKRNLMYGNSIFYGKRPTKNELLQRNFAKGKISWHNRWFLGLPVSYWWSAVIGSFLLYIGVK